MALGDGWWVVGDLVQLPQKLGVWCWCWVLVDLVQLSKGLGVWFRVLGVCWGAWCWVLCVWSLVFVVRCGVILSTFLRGWVLGVGSWVFDDLV